MKTRMHQAIGTRSSQISEADLLFTALLSCITEETVRPIREDRSVPTSFPLHDVARTSICLWFIGMHPFRAVAAKYTTRDGLLEDLSLHVFLEAQVTQQWPMYTERRGHDNTPKKRGGTKLCRIRNITWYGARPKYLCYRRGTFSAKKTKHITIILHAHQDFNVRGLLRTLPPLPYIHGGNLPLWCFQPQGRG